MEQAHFDVWLEFVKRFNPRARELADRLAPLVDTRLAGLDPQTEELELETMEDMEEIEKGLHFPSLQWLLFPRSIVEELGAATDYDCPPSSGCVILPETHSYA